MRYFIDTNVDLKVVVFKIPYINQLILESIMKGMLFFIIGLLIIFGLFMITQENTSLSDEIGKQELKNEAEK